MTPKILVITGPTATGKTALGIALAEKTGGEIVSADSMQLYQHMDIGTAKPTPEELARVPHHMIGIVPPSENYSVARYAAEASGCVDDILRRGKLPVVVGGTGLYIGALVAGHDFSAEADADVRGALSARYDALGGEVLLAELRAVDPMSAARLHPNDKKRLVRALEVFKATGVTITEHDARTRALAPRYDACVIALSYRDREDLYRRINARVDAMLEMGLLREVRALLDMGLTPEHTAMQAIGYKELTGVLLGREALDEAVARIKMESRRYAKRQLSWLRRDQNAHWILWDKEPDFANGLQISTEYLEKYVYNRAV
ncbi:tRNA dimethylallyltransferase [Sporobacter termitidis DSM 10068]|uniref:tRNA dimethylallyltransferase n=1 Tax=Sporobacter termitidis DSM 10068 TaxID=1123282 RepID=A0A1M5Z899_9FIRM|nr:tRNA (adenosine(37)-N6)-dimethylallyltransferase MiaA [Sporobacter termitidis]SHI20123.1 tRNA dimethylallyltransferase [Sporobacter termitidis DSM 10068]